MIEKGKDKPVKRDYYNRPDPKGAGLMVNFMVTPAMHDRLYAFAKHQKQTVSRVLRDAVEYWLQEGHT